jgi:AraC-like DNA-binding protein
VRLFLDLETRERGPGRNGVAEFREFVKRAFPEPVHLGSGIDAEVRERLAVLRREGDDREPGYEHRVRAVCTDLMVLLARRAAPRPHARRKGGVPPVVAQAMEFIQKHHADPGLRLGAIAWHVGRAEEHLARLFRRDTGRSVFDHVRELRIHRARTLLRDPALSVTTVAERCGFSSLAFFSRTFRKLTGVTPSAYRAGLDVRLQTAPVPERYAIRSRA